MGTAEAVELLREEFPDLAIQQFDKDTITTAGKLQKALERFAKKETQIVVGTQMLAKGHDYPDITLAIIVGLDYILGRGHFLSLCRSPGVRGVPGRRRSLCRPTTPSFSANI